MLGRILTADALLRRGWENDYFCPLCVRNLETPSHLLFECPWSKEIWGWVASMANMPALCPATWTGDTKFASWMQRCYDVSEKNKKKGLLSLIHLITWELWKERNHRVFQRACMDVGDLRRIIRDEIKLWNLAGAGIPFDPG